MIETKGERIGRRSYLKYAGAGVLAAAIAGIGYYYFRRKPEPTVTPTSTSSPTPTVTPTQSCTNTTTQLDPFLEKEIYPINSRFAEWLAKENPYYYGFKNDGLDDHEKEVLIKGASLDTLAPFLIRMPEVYTKEAELEQVKKYADLVKAVKARDENAALWILETGLFMEDKKISDWVENFVDESLNKSDLLRVYVSKFVMDGIRYVPRKSIKVDGKQDDWNGIQPLAADEKGDVEVTTNPASDIKAVYVAKDSDNLYVMIQCYDRASEDNLTDLYFNRLPRDPASNFMFGKDGFVSWSRNWREKGVRVGYDEVAEVSFPLKLLNEMFGNSDKIHIRAAVYIPSIDKWNDSVGWLEVNIVNDFDKLKNFDPSNSGNFGYLTDDLFNLPEINRDISKADANALRQIEAIVNASRTDYQLRKGIYLIDEYGVPNQELFSFEVPKHNTQLQVLYWLAQDREIPKEYYRVALACGLDYGSVITLGNDEVKRAVREYVPRIFDFIVESDGIVERQGGDWLAKDYPLEACISLVWATPGSHYPNDKSLFSKWTEAFYNWYHIFSKVKRKPMDISDFNYLFTSMNTLGEMRDWMLKNFLDPNYKPPEVNYSPPYQEHQKKYMYCYNDSIDKVAADLDDYFFVNGEHFDSRILGEKDGEPIINYQYIMVMIKQWKMHISAT